MDEAIKIAKRSTIKTHKTGAVIVRGDDIISNGWSHVPANKAVRSLHAEMHALARGRHLNFNGARIYVTTISGKSGNFTFGKPCLNCAIALRAAGIRSVYYSIPSFPIEYKLLILDEELRRHNLKVYGTDTN